jgi:glutathione peroxidase
VTLKDIALTTLDGTPATLAELSDGATLVVNVASKCGLPPQYTALGKLANGDDRHPLYTELTKAADSVGEAGDLQWNFEKFLLAPNGEVVNRFRPPTEPDAPEVISAIEAVLPR